MFHRRFLIIAGSLTPSSFFLSKLKYRKVTSMSVRSTVLLGASLISVHAKAMVRGKKMSATSHLILAQRLLDESFVDSKSDAVVGMCRVSRKGAVLLV